ncbi:hypothetical protein ACEPPN_007213 [Leptodophora sp. 'Broadleaf-Isolate-01']
MIGALLDEIVDTLNQPKIEKVQYLGESTGGIFGEFVAARNPERLHSLSICGSLLFPSKSAQDMLAVGYATPEKAIRALESRGRGEVVIPVLKTDQGAPEGFMDWWLEKFTIPSTEGICAYTEFRIVHKINVPMLLLTSPHCVLVDIEDQKRLARTVKRHNWRSSKAMDMKSILSRLRYVKRSF